MEEIIYFHKDMGALVPSCCLSGQNGFDDFLFHLCSCSNDFNKPSSLPEVLYIVKKPVLLKMLNIHPNVKR